jgi:hypothetical protein
MIKLIAEEQREVKMGLANQHPALITNKKKKKASNEFEITNKEKVKEKLLPKIKLFF